MASLKRSVCFSVLDTLGKSRSVSVSCGEKPHENTKTARFGILIAFVEYECSIILNTQVSPVKTLALPKNLHISISEILFLFLKHSLSMYLLQIRNDLFLCSWVCSWCSELCAFQKIGIQNRRHD